MHLEVIDLLAASDRSESVAQCQLAGGSGEFRKGMSEELALLESEAAPTAVGIADHAHGVRDQDQALGVAQDLAGEITLTLQFGLRLAETADVQDQSAVLLN